jgi:hypothetical protein
MKFLIRVGIAVFLYFGMFGFMTTGIDIFGNLNETNFTWVRITAMFCSVILASIFKVTLPTDKKED